MSNLSPQDSKNKLIFLTSVINKMSRLFSELNDLYLKAMLPNPDFGSQQLLGITSKISQLTKGYNHGVVTQQSSLPEELQARDSFLLFLDDHRQEILKEFPGCSDEQVKELARQIWKDLVKEEKQYYERLACESSNKKKAESKKKQSNQGKWNNKGQQLKKKREKKFKKGKLGDGRMIGQREVKKY